MGNPEADSSAEIPHSDAPGPAIVTQTISLTPRVDIHASGANVALNRWPNIECSEIDAGIRVGTIPSWKPGWGRVRTVMLTFPEAIQFLPPKEDADNGELQTIRPPKPKRDEDGEGGTERKKPTRLKPPSDALSLEDRLFYILQPPLETTLAGQELIMPFEPFPHQYEGIGWLFSQKHALLADEMGLGKTMQTITAVRLLLRSGQVRKVQFVCAKPLIPNWQREFRTWAE